MRFLTLVLSVIILLALAVTPAAAGVVFTLDPFDGALAGAPGQVLGWGLTIQNDDSGWLVITSATYDQSQSIGDFSDFVTPQFLTYAVAPNGVWSEAFDAATQMGLGSYVIGDFALAGRHGDRHTRVAIRRAQYRSQFRGRRHRHSLRISGAVAGAGSRNGRNRDRHVHARRPARPSPRSPERP